MPPKARRARQERVLTHSLMRPPRMAGRQRWRQARQPTCRPTTRRPQERLGRSRTGAVTDSNGERAAGEHHGLICGQEEQNASMPTGDFESGQTTPLLIPEPVWREWQMNGVDADGVAELRAEHGEAVGYEFGWGQIIEEVVDANPNADSDNLDDALGLAVRWHFVLCDVYTAFLDGGGKLGELGDLAIMVLAEVEHARSEFPADVLEDTLPTGISFDEGNNISVFAVCVSVGPTSRMPANG